MKVRAQWRANIADCSSPEDIERSIKKYLQQYPGLEALQDYYGVAATEFWIDDHYIAPYKSDQSEDGLEVCVSIEGEMERRFDPELIGSWEAYRIWEELADHSDLIGFPDRFEVSVSALSERDQ